jgi:prepilin-type N-terminal cleavage/methylation domain-containing protein
MEPIHFSHGFIPTLMRQLGKTRTRSTALLVSGFTPLETRPKRTTITKPVFLTGFTLVELIVVMGIIGVVSSVVITSQSTFNKELGLSNAAYDVALTLRSIQTYGLGSKVVQNSPNAPHGLYFARATPTTFTHFADIYPAAGSSSPDAQPGNSSFDSAQNEKVFDYILGNGVTISNFCAGPSPWRCATPLLGAMGQSHDALAIVFSRPNADPSIKIDGIAVSQACLIITSSQGGTRFVSLSSSGQIRARATQCP